MLRQQRRGHVLVPRKVSNIFPILSEEVADAVVDAISEQPTGGDPAAGTQVFAETFLQDPRISVHLLSALGGLGSQKLITEIG